MSITNERAARILDECPWDATGGDDAECCIAADMGAKALRRASEVESELARLRAKLLGVRVVEKCASLGTALAATAVAQTGAPADGKAFAEQIVLLTPPSADQTAAIRHVRDAVFTANAAVACGGK